MSHTFKVGDRVVWARPHIAVPEIKVGARATVVDLKYFYVDWDEPQGPRGSWHKHVMMAELCVNFDLYAAVAERPTTLSASASTLARVSCLTPGACPKCAGPTPCDYDH